jgi:hypothetical protein
VLSFSFVHIVVEDNTMVKRKIQHYVQKKKKTLRSKEKDKTRVKRKRQHYGQKKKTTVSSKEKENTMVKRKRQHYRQKENDHSVVFFL